MKRTQYEILKSIRGDWGSVKPITLSFKDKKRYSRKRKHKNKEYDYDE